MHQIIHDGDALFVNIDLWITYGSIHTVQIIVYINFDLFIYLHYGMNNIQNLVSVIYL